MFDRLRRSFVSRLWLVTGCGIALMLALVANALYHSRQQHIEQAQVETYASAAVLESDLEQILEKANVALFSVKSEVERELARGTVALPAAVARFAAVVHREVPDLNSLGFASAEGLVVAGSNTSPAGTRMDDRPHFQRLRDDPVAGLVMSEPTIGRRTGTPLVALGRRIERPDGRFAGIAYATISIDRFQRAMAAAETGPDGVAALRSGNLSLLARWPPAPEGKSEIVPPALRELAAGPLTAASYQHVSPVDGVERVVSYRRMEKHSLHLTVGRSREQYLAHFNRDAVVTLALSLALAVFALAAAFGLQRSWRRQRETERRLSMQVDTDELTGAASRRHFFALAQAEIERQRRYGGPLSLLMLDIDHFKEVNDTHGHKAGDRVLCRLVDVCAEIVRRVDFVGRVGGEEFAILLPETGAEQASAVADRLRLAASHARVVREEGPPIRVTVSVGVATAKEAGENLDTLMSRADTALYEAKHGGRDRVCVAPPS